MRILVYLLLAVLCVGCGGPEPRRPVREISGSFLKTSVARSKKHLALEERLIQESMAKDTFHDYKTSPNGFWYYFEMQNDTATYLPQPNDHIQFSYTIMTMHRDTLYSAEALGSVSYIVDKEVLFPGLQHAVKLLKVKEKATFLFPSSLAYGYPGDGRAIGSQTPIQASVTLHTIRRSQNRLTPKLQTP